MPAASWAGLKAMSVGFDIGLKVALLDLQRLSENQFKYRYQSIIYFPFMQHVLIPVVIGNSRQQEGPVIHLSIPV